MSRGCKLHPHRGSELVRKLTSGAYTSNHDGCRDACTTVRGQGAPV